MHAVAPQRCLRLSLLSHSGLSQNLLRLHMRCGRLVHEGETKQVNKPHIKGFQCLPSMSKTACVRLRSKRA